MTPDAAPDVPAPVDVEGRAPRTGRLEPALRWLASCQGSWPPRRPTLTQRAGPTGAPRPLEAGAARADAAADAGAGLLVVHGAGEDAGALLVLAVLLALEPVRAVGTGGGAGWTERVLAVRDGLARARVHRGDPETLVRVVQADAVAELAGVLAQAARRRTPALLDGSATVAAAALVAGRLTPGASAWWLAGQAPPGAAARAAHAELGLVPLLDLELDAPEGADLAASVLKAAVELVTGGDA